MLCVGIWLAVDKTSFIHFAHFAKFTVDEGVEVITMNIAGINSVA